MKLYIVLEKDGNGFFVAEVPSMPGCFSVGSTAEEALGGMHQLIEEWFQAMAGREIQEQAYLC